jgi:hypothetical protein
VTIKSPRSSNVRPAMRMVAASIASTVMARGLAAPAAAREGRGVSFRSVLP